MIRPADIESGPLRIGAIEALGAIGTVHALPALKHARSGLLFPSDVKRAARRAIAQIEKRPLLPAGGELALAASEEQQGGLSLPAAGSISVTGSDGE